MGENGDGAGCRRQSEQWNFFQDQPAQGNFREREGRGCRRFFQGSCAAGSAPTEPLQRPPIQQEQETGERDHRGLAHERQGEGQDHPAIAARAGLRGVTHISPQAKQEKKSAQHILALRDPGHGIDLQRMQGEEGGHQRTSPKRAGHRVQHEEEQQNVGGVKEQVAQVVPAGLETEELAVEHVRHPGDGMPVRLLAMHILEGPLQARRGQSLLHDRVGRDVVGVVVIDEVKTRHPPEHGEGDEGQGQAGVKFPVHQRERGG